MRAERVARAREALAARTATRYAEFEAAMARVELALEQVATQREEEVVDWLVGEVVDEAVLDEVVRRAERAIARATRAVVAEIERDVRAKKLWALKEKRS